MANLLEHMKRATKQFDDENKKKLNSGEIDKAEYNRRKDELNTQVAYQEWKDKQDTGLGSTIKKFGGTIVKAMIPGMQQKAFEEAKTKSAAELQKSKEKFTAETGIYIAPANPVKQQQQMAKFDGIFNSVSQFNGLNTSQAQVNTSTGGISVPQAAQGNGIWGSLLNTAASVVTKELTKGAQVQPTVASNIAQQSNLAGQQLLSGGGITISGSGTIGQPVTTNTTGTKQNGNGGGSIVLIVLILGFLAWIFGLIPKSK